MDKLLEGILKKVKDVSPEDWRKDISYETVRASEGRMFASGCRSYTKNKESYSCVIRGFLVSIERLRSDKGYLTPFEDKAYFLVVKDDLVEEQFLGKDVKRAFFDVENGFLNYEKTEEDKETKMRIEARKKKLNDTFLNEEE